jgi:hypothetical protein
MKWGAVVSLQPFYIPRVRSLYFSDCFLAQKELGQEPRYFKGHILSLVFALVAWISITANVYVLTKWLSR